MPVRGDLHIIKFINPNQFDFSEEPGKRIQSVFFRTSDQECAWVEELGARIDTLVARKPAWAKWGVVRLTVAELAALGATFSLTTEGCDWDDLKDAHGEITGYDRTTRGGILSALDRNYIDRAPDRSGTETIACECGQQIEVRVQYGYDLRGIPDDIVCVCGITHHTEGKPVDVIF